MAKANTQSSNGRSETRRLPDQIRVLYVDDNPHFGELVATGLECEGAQFVVETAAGATAGLESLDDDIDCIVSDYGMPGMDGIDFLETVRETYPELPFILYTGKGSEAVASEAISAGVSDYLQKQPGTDQLDTLAETIAAHVTEAQDSTGPDVQDPYLSQAQAVANLGCWRLDLIEGNLAWSDTAYDIFGMSPEESLTYDRFLEHVHPEDRAFVDEQWRAALDGDEYDIEHRIVTDDGETRWVRERADFERGEDDTAIAAIGVVQDITDRKERDRRLRLFKRTIEAAGHSIYITDRDGTIEYVNPAFEAVTGYTGEEAVGETPSILKSGEHDEAFYEDLWETILGGDVWEGEVINTRKDGQRYVVNQTIAPVTDDGGAITHFVAVNTDITERRDKQRELHRIWQAIDRTHTPLCLTDPAKEDNPLVYVNEAFTSLCGYSKDELLGENCRFLQGAETDPETVARLRDAIDAEEPVTVELRNYRKDGTMFWNELTVTPLYDTEGNLVRYLGTQRDITERKEREQHIQVLDRVLRHNLRNDVTAIQGLAETIQADTSGPVATEAEAIMEKSDQLVETAEKQRAIMDILWNRPTQETIDITGVVERVVAVASGEYPDATIDVTCPGGVTAVATSRIGQAVRELVTNALQHNDQDAPAVSLTVSATDDWVQIEIADNGPSIPEMERQIGADGEDLDPLYHGSGLGLWLVYWIVTRSNGRVVFRENEPRGNRVRVELPREATDL